MSSEMAYEITAITVQYFYRKMLYELGVDYLG